MNQLPLTTKEINAAADARALEVLGKVGYEKSKDVRMSIIDDFKAAAEWTMKAMLNVSPQPDDQAHQMITTERYEQILRGYDADHDDHLPEGRLLFGAVLLLVENSPLEHKFKDFTWPWPADEYPDKRGKLDNINRLRIAGALIAALLDRELRRSASKQESEVSNEHN